MEKKVSGCADCPMCNTESDGWDTTYICNYKLSLDGDNDFEIPDKETTPDWCPLKKEPITIIITNGEE